MPALADAFLTLGRDTFIASSIAELLPDCPPRRPSVLVALAQATDFAVRARNIMRRRAYKKCRKLATI